MSNERDFFDNVLKYIDQMLMEEEEDVQNYKPCMFHESSAFQAAEKSFYDVLGQKYPPSDHLLDVSTGNSTSQSRRAVLENFTESTQIHDQGSESVLDQSSIVHHSFQPNIQSFTSSLSNFSNYTPFVHSVNSHFTTLSDLGSSRGQQQKINQFLSNNSSKKKKTHYQEDRNDNYLQDEPSHKQLASFSEEPEQSEIYDKVLLCPDLNLGLHGEESESHGTNFSKTSAKLRNQGQSKEPGKKQVNRKELIDLRSLLTTCAQALVNGNINTVNEILKKTSQHSSPYGDGTERLAHYFGNAIRARLDGTGIKLYADFSKKRVSAAHVLKAYQAYVTACPFQRMSNIFANKSIAKLATGEEKLHIIDFGILYGFQWPCIIQGLSERPDGPPKLRITGIELPQPGFRPAERVEATGRHLANYCKRFNVPFEYNAIAKKWDDIKLEDIKIEKDEKLVVNCLYRLRNVPDETVMENSPRDAVLDLIKRICPDLFVHGVLHGTYNGPFFLTRFRDALFHFSSLFDMFDATASREDKNRLVFEQEVFGREAMNVIACEGPARIERPETYKKWQGRDVKVGFRQLELDLDLMKEVREKVKLSYHKDFLVDEESNWMLQGWKGRILYALSLWKPVHE